jgi:hypothetical protein
MMLNYPSDTRDCASPHCGITARQFLDRVKRIRIGLEESTILAQRATDLNKTIFLLVFEFTKRSQE